MKALEFCPCSVKKWRDKYAILYSPGSLFFFQSQAEGMWPRNPGAKLATNLLSALLSYLLGPDYSTIICFLSVLDTKRCAIGIFLLNCSLRFITYSVSTALWLSKRLGFVCSSVSLWAWELSVEVLLLMTAGWACNWLVDMSVFISDVSVGAEERSGGGNERNLLHL